MSSIFKYIVKAAILGLAIAGVLLLVFPSLRSGHSLFQPAPAQQPISFANAARRAAPAVVNIYTRSFSTSQLSNQPPTVTSEGLGSGVIMSAKGYILTNMHVIANADQIVVALQDGRVFNAELVGSDPITDLAVLKIDSNGQLPVIPQSDHLHTQVGDVVLAIGNPYNVGQTVTQGIISATGRSGMSSTGRQDFLQTDAAINRGNSGGALVNTQGQLVGINTAAYHLGQNSETYGISFAIPYQLAKRVMGELIHNGKVVRGYMGVDARNINPTLARLWGLSLDHGILIEQVDPNGPAASAGLQKGDILTQINKTTITSVKQAMDIVAEAKPGTHMSLSVTRKGKPQTLDLTVGELKIRTQQTKS